MCLCLSVCFILTFLIVEIHIPTQIQNAVFLTALQHFSSHPHLTDATESLSIHTSPSPPQAQSPHQQGSGHLSDDCGSVQRKGSGGSPLSGVWMAVPSAGDTGSPVQPPIVLWPLEVFTLSYLGHHVGESGDGGLKKK